MNSKHKESFAVRCGVEGVLPRSVNDKKNHFLTIMTKLNKFRNYRD